MIHKVYSPMATITACDKRVTNKTEVASPAVWEMLWVYVNSQSYLTQVKPMAEQHGDKYQLCSDCLASPNCFRPFRAEPGIKP